MPVLDAHLLSQLSGVKLRARAVMEGVLSGLHKSPHQGQSVEFAEHKEYAPGDELRHLDWKAFGKFDRYYVKRFEHETNLRAMMVIDASGSMNYKSGPLSKLDVAKVLAGALSYLLVRQQDAAGVSFVGGGKIEDVPARAAANHINVIIDALGALEAKGSTDLFTAADHLAERLPRRSLVIVFSDFFDDREEALKRLLGLRARKHDVAVFHLVDPYELTFPFEDPTLFLSMEDEQRLEINPREIKQSYLEEFQAFLKRTRETCTAADVDYERVRLDEPLDAVLLRFFGAKGDAMTFAFPAMLWGTLAAFIPLLIHLFDRRRPRPHPFGAISFVLRSQKRTASRLKLKRLLIYALRTLILCAIPLALAKPELTRQQMAVVTKQKVAATVVVLDASLSMRWADGEPLFEVGRGLAKSAVQDLAHEEPATVLVCGQRPVVRAPLSFDRKSLIATLDEAQPDYAPSDLNTCLELAAQSLADSPMLGRRIVLVSDFTQGALKFERPLPTFKGPQGESLRPDIVLRDAAAGRTELPNRAVIDVRAEPATQMGPRAYQFTAVVKNFSDTPAKDVELALRIDGKTVGKGFVDLAAQGTAQKVLNHRFELGGTFNVEVSLPTDALPDDDRRSLMVQVPRELKALLVNGSPSPQKYRDEAFFVDAALSSAGSPVRPVLRDTEAAWAEDFLGYDVVMLLNVAAPPEAVAARLKTFVEGGGGLWVSMGDNVDPDLWNTRMGSLLPRALRVVKTSIEPQAADARTRAAKLSQMSLAHPLFSPFTGKAREGLLSSRFYRYMLLEGDSAPGTAPGEVLASLDDGAPALTASRPGKGRVLLFTSTVDRDWSDFSIRTSFLPLMQRMGAWLAGALDERDDLRTLVGNVLTLKADASTEPALAKSPKGVELKVEAQPDKTFKVGPLDEPGAYTVIGGNGQPLPSLAFSVVLDTAESELTRFKPEELSEYFGEEAVRVGSGSSDAPKTPLWTWLILAAVVAFCAEGVLLRK